MSGFYEPSLFGFVPALEAACEEIRGELAALGDDVFAAAPDSLTTVADGYDERGWLWFDLVQNAARCPRTTAALARVPGVRNAGFSCFRVGTRLYPHRGELPNVLRCHLPLVVPTGDLGIRIAGETRVWQRGRCLIFDDSLEHDAWNRGDGDRIVLLVTFARPATA
ncbi:MAG: aspartyl/asparaginyl beta-hydroxylase domain-containing protein [Planctomycetes bacterium]|nr:aspartyl/asparaginyl beta-hydroxylase domain-containing protein [Planctomycetota bacterium]